MTTLLDPPVWCWLCFADAVPHVCPASLVRAVVANVTERGTRLLSMEDCQRVTLDGPQFFVDDPPRDEFTIDGLTIEIATVEVDGFVRLLRSLDERRDRGVAYYKLHAHRRSLVLSPAQRATLLSLMRDRLDPSRMSTVREPSAAVFARAYDQAHAESAAPTVAAADDVTTPYRTP